MFFVSMIIVVIKGKQTFNPLTQTLKPITLCAYDTKPVLF